MLSRFELLGSVTHSPEFLRTAAGTPFCFLRISTRRGVEQQRIDVHFVTVWSPAAQRISESLSIGDVVYVEGRIEATIADRNDQLRASSIRFVASRVVPVSVRMQLHNAESEPVGTFIEAPSSGESS